MKFNDFRLTFQKSHGSQLDSLKVIVYESDTLNPECIVEADPEEEPTVRYFDNFIVQNFICFYDLILFT